MGRWSLAWGAAALACIAWPHETRASSGLAVPAMHPHLVGGEPAESCGWPTTVYLDYGESWCTGVLVHPLIALTAAHCLPEDVTASVRFGEEASTAIELQPTDFCRANPDFVTALQGLDYGFCKLAAPIEGIAVTPIAFGCEESFIEVGSSITYVGFGEDDAGDVGTKRFLTQDISEIDEDVGEFISGTPEQHASPGDSGAPVFMRLPALDGGDDSWRLVGIHSWGFPTGASGNTIASNAVAFVESESGVDITPCHTPDGAWAPSEECRDFPLEPGAGGEGSYDTSCAAGPVVDFPATCGAPLPPDGEDTTSGGSESSSAGAEESSGPSDDSGPSETSGDGPPATGSDSGCGCATERPGSPGWAWIVALSAWCRRRVVG